MSWVPFYGLVDASDRTRLRGTASYADGPRYMLSLTRFRPDRRDTRDWARFGYEAVLVDPAIERWP